MTGGATGQVEGHFARQFWGQDAVDGRGGEFEHSVFAWQASRGDEGGVREDIRRDGMRGGAADQAGLP